ncbi:hypothetical protein HMPREF9412_0394 [Paenibacillus sp. HGF5]|nr:hypothetical protein HMPREF9412_0394 [Paenibacillus sp. HGF5]
MERKPYLNFTKVRYIWGIWVYFERKRASAECLTSIFPPGY